MEDETAKTIKVVDIKVPFISIVIFMVKAAIASIPAFIILSVIGAAIMAVLGSIGGFMDMDQILRNM